MFALFFTGLFYNADSDYDEDSEESTSETMDSYGANDFLISFYTMILVLPITKLFKFLFERNTPIKSCGASS